MPKLVGLVFQRCDQVGMRVAEGTDGDARGEIQVAIAVFGDQPDALAAFEA